MTPFKLQSPIRRVDGKQLSAQTQSKPILAPMSYSNLHALLAMPVNMLSQGKMTQRDINEFVAMRRKQEADMAKSIQVSNFGFNVALAQYYPQDWGLYNEYSDAFEFVSECAFAIKLKKRLIWKRGLDITASSEVVRQRVIRRLKERKVLQNLKEMTVLGLKFGNAYAEKVDNSTRGVWDQDSYSLKGYNPATQFYGLKIVDSRAMRAFVNPDVFDVKRARQKVDRYVQRFFATYSLPWSNALANNTKDTEISLHPDQIVHLRFNHNSGQIYGDSLYRDSLSNIKGYLIMMHYLPAIVEKRAYPLLHVRMGKDIVKAADGREHTYLPTDEDFNSNKAAITGRLPHEDIFTDILTEIVQVYNSDGALRGIQEYLQAWKERLLIGMGVPTSIFDLIKSGTEIKWGDLKFQTLIDECVEYQGDIEDTLNEDIIPALTPEGGEATATFNQPTSQDLLQEIDPFLKLYYANLISQEYTLKSLHIPESAMEGKMYSDVMSQMGNMGTGGQGQPQQPNKPANKPTDKKGDD